MSVDRKSDQDLIASRRGLVDRVWPALRVSVRALTVVARVFVIGVALSVVLVGIGRFALPPGTALMVQRGFEGEDVRRDWVSLDEVSPHLVRAVIAAEDSKFCSHAGFDGEAIREALGEAQNGERPRGASTITQQTAKNVYLHPAGGYVRKGVEAWFTIWIETAWSKRRTMEAYLNVAEWGDGLFGAQAAAQTRFGKSAADLTRREAALLAAVLPNPHRWRVDPPGPYVSRRAGTLQARMRVVEGEGLASCVLPQDAR